MPNSEPTKTAMQINGSPGFFTVCQTYDRKFEVNHENTVKIDLGWPIGATRKQYFFHLPIETLYFIILTSSKNRLWRENAPLTQ